MVWLGQRIAPRFEFLSLTGWVILLASTAAVLLALTPVRALEKLGASKLGSFLLYVVLITIGAKTTVTSLQAAPAFMVYGTMVLILHGILLFAIGRALRVPLFLLATASQANVGGPISAPILAVAYRPGSAHIGVLMGVAGALIGTYLGAVGGYLCRAFVR
jgi:uncharacterized membrane protein